MTECFSLLYLHMREQLNEIFYLRLRDFSGPPLWQHFGNHRFRTKVDRSSFILKLNVYAGSLAMTFLCVAVALLLKAVLWGISLTFSVSLPETHGTFNLLWVYKKKKIICVHCQVKFNSVIFFALDQKQSDTKTIIKTAIITVFGYIISPSLKLHNQGPA